MHPPGAQMIMIAGEVRLCPAPHDYIVSRSTVYYWLEAGGVPRKKSPHIHQHRPSRPDSAEIRTLYEEGYGLDALAQQYGQGRKTIKD